MTPVHTSITIRPAGPGDTAALSRLAALDSAIVPDAPVLLAEVGGQLQAAVSLWDGSAIADPFEPSADIVALLHAHIAGARGGRPTRREALLAAIRPRRRDRPAPAPARWRAA